jgi:hypothetical protein
MPASYDVPAAGNSTCVYPTPVDVHHNSLMGFSHGTASMALYYNQSRRRNPQYSPSTISTMIDVLVRKPPTVLIPGYSTFCP